MSINVPGVVGVVVFNLLIVGVGIWAAWWMRKNRSASKSETIMVGGRNIGIVVGCFTMTASWVGGGMINGTTESMYTKEYGLLWTLAPVAYSLSVVIAGAFFAKPMRKRGYVTIQDPIQEKFGEKMGALLCLITIISENLYCASILNALGATLSVIVGLMNTVAVICSTVMAVLYTIMGGLYSVAYTDVIQLTCMAFGLVLSFPFALTNEATSSISETAYSGDGGWLGVWDTATVGTYIDMALVMTLGGVPVQSMFQRILSADTSKNAQLICYVGGVASFLLTIPPAIMGAVAVSTNWTLTGYMNGSGITPADMGQERMILPIVLQYLTPPAISFVGMGAVSAAVMSSIDSSILSQSSIFSRNVYKNVFRPQASEREVVWAMRVSIVIMAGVSTGVALAVQSVFHLLYLCADFLYVILFPQLVSVIHCDPNTYGSLTGYIIGLFLRLGGGEVLLDWQAFIPYPGGEMFPHKTFAMLVSFATINGVSYLAKYLFERRILDEKYDFLRCNLAHGGRSLALLKETGEAREANGANGAVQRKQELPMGEMST